MKRMLAAGLQPVYVPIRATESQAVKKAGNCCTSVRDDAGIEMVQPRNQLEKATATWPLSGSADTTAPADILDVIVPAACTSSNTTSSINPDCGNEGSNYATSIYSVSSCDDVYGWEHELHRKSLDVETQPLDFQRETRDMNYKRANGKKMSLLYRVLNLNMGQQKIAASSSSSPKPSSHPLSYPTPPPIPRNGSLTLNAPDGAP